MLTAILGRLEHDVVQAEGGPPKKPARHVPLLQRAREPALEERLAKLEAAGRAAAGGSVEGGDEGGEG